MKHTELTGRNYESVVVNSKELVVIDFWATWGGPCRMMGQTLEDLGDEETTGVKLCKVNVDEEAELADKFSVRVIPTLVFIKDNLIAFRAEGVKTKDQLIALMNKYK